MATITHIRESNGHVTWSGRTDDRTAKAIAEHLVEDGGVWIFDDGQTLRVAKDGQLHVFVLSRAYHG